MAMGREGTLFYGFFLMPLRVGLEGKTRLLFSGSGVGYGEKSARGCHPFALAC